MEYTKLLKDLVDKHHSMSIYVGCTDGSEERASFYYFESKEKFDKTIEGKKWTLQFKKEDGNTVTLEGTGINEFLNRMIRDENNHPAQFVKFEVEE